MAQLAQVVDPDALDACDGARAKLALAVDAAWMSHGARLRVAVPKRLPCARCDGGGCDGCERSGVLRAPDDPETRTLLVELPAGQPAGATVVLRLTRPFPDDDRIAQLLIHLSPGETADDRVSRVGTGALAPVEASGGPRPVVVAALMAAAALLGWLAANL